MPDNDYRALQFVPRIITSGGLRIYLSGHNLDSGDIAPGIFAFRVLLGGRGIGRHHRAGPFHLMHSVPLVAKLCG